MPYCPKCGVETDPSVRACPLCATPIPVFAELGDGEPAWPEPGRPDDPTKRYLTSRQIRGRVIWALSAVLVAVAVAVAGFNWFVSGAMTWGVYALASLTAAWGLTVSMFAWRSPFILVPVWFALIALMLGVFDLADGRLDWLVPLGLPLAILPFVLTVGAYLLTRRRRGYFVLAVAVSSVAVGLAAIDVLANHWLGHEGLSWSLVTSLVLVPLALVFFFLHFGLRLSLDLKRTFHF